MQGASQSGHRWRMPLWGPEYILGEQCFSYKPFTVFSCSFYHLWHWIYYYMYTVPIKPSVSTLPFSVSKEAVNKSSPFQHPPAQHISPSFTESNILQLPFIQPQTTYISSSLLLPFYLWGSIILYFFFLIWGKKTKPENMRNWGHSLFPRTILMQVYPFPSPLPSSLPTFVTGFFKPFSLLLLLSCLYYSPV